MGFDWLSALGILISLSGWVSFGYEIFTSNPKVNGKIIGHMSGELQHPQDPKKKTTIFLIYLYLVNKRRNSIHVVDYQLEIERGKVYEKMSRFYGLENMKDPVFDSENGVYIIEDFSKQIITARVRPLTRDQPNFGFVSFFSEEKHETFQDNVEKFKITCRDVFGKEFVIVTNRKDLPEMHFLQDIARIKFTPK